MANHHGQKAPLRKNNIGLIVPRINRNFFSNIIHGIESVTDTTGYNLIICQSNEHLNSEISKIHALIEAQVAGIIMSVSSQTLDSVHSQLILDNKIPLVQFDRINPDLNCSKVMNDNESGSYDATSHLIKMGYKNIAYFTGPLNLNTYQCRLNGYKKALQENGISIVDNLICENVITQELGIVATRELLMRKIVPDAICSAGDFSALGALDVIKDRGLSVPTDIGITGFSNEPFTSFITPSLTTLEQYSIDMGKTAANLLLKQISNADNIPGTVTIKPKLIIRESTNRF